MTLKNACLERESFKLERSDISLYEKIGSGYYGVSNFLKINFLTVWQLQKEFLQTKDVWRGENKVTKQQVAVKKLKNGFNQKIVDDEAEFMM